MEEKTAVLGVFCCFVFCCWRTWLRSSNVNFHPESQNQTNTHPVTGNVAGSLCRHKAFVASLTWASLVAQRLKHLPAVWETWVQSLGQEDPLEKEIAIHSSILAWRIPWMEESGGLQSMSRKELDTTERLHFHFHLAHGRHTTLSMTSAYSQACQSDNTSLLLREE